MALTALEWLALPDDEREKRMGELSAHECFLLRTTYEYMPKGPEHYPNGPLKRQEHTQEEMEKFWHEKFEVLKSFGIIPQDVPYEEWARKGRPLTWRKGK